MLAQIEVFIRSEAGTTAIEYALIAGILSISIVAALTLVRGEIQNAFTSVVIGFKSATN